MAYHIVKDARERILTSIYWGEGLSTVWKQGKKKLDHVLEYLNTRQVEIGRVLSDEDKLELTKDDNMGVCVGFRDEQKNISKPASNDLFEEAKEFLKPARIKAYGSLASNSLEGDYGTWDDWTRLLADFAAHIETQTLKRVADFVKDLDDPIECDDFRDGVRRAADVTLDYIEQLEKKL